MKRLVESTYGFPVHYKQLLTLVPGENLVPDETWKKVKRVSARLGAHLDEGLVIDKGFYYWRFLDLLKAGREPDPNDLSVDGAAEVAARVKGAAKLRWLAENANRLGVRRIFRQALGEER